MNKGHLISSAGDKMTQLTQLTDFQRQVIVLFKEEQPTWGLTKCSEILPNFFGNISKTQVDRVYRSLKRKGPEETTHSKSGTGTTSNISTPVKDRIVTLAVTPPDKSRRHSSQRQIASQLGISKGTVFNVLKESQLKCFRRIRCHKLTESHREARVSKASALLQRFTDSWKNIWFSDESCFSISAPLNRQNERIYREVGLKTDIPADDLIVQIDKQQQTIMCYAAVSWHGKTGLRFIEGVAGNQENIPVSRKKKKTVNQQVYTEEMCPLMFSDINAIMNNDTWTWMQDGAKAHTAKSTVEWLRRNTHDFIEPQQWPSKSPDLNVLDYSLWAILLAGVAENRSTIENIDQLKTALTECWDAIPMETVQKACATFLLRLRACIDMQGGHFEHTL